ncbi:MAG TPA: hypothetical protein VLF62_00465 [Candidatus Saccharimonadales bacterium]|nr:hypothetical protein [Candidatus Saccharimonadales bacterium]
MVAPAARQQGGYIALMAVLILGAVATAIGITLLLTGTDAQRLTLGEQQSRQARALAVACGQEALQQIHDNLAFTATNTSMNLGQGSCKYSVGTSSGIGSVRLVSASGTVGDITRKVQAGVTVNASTITVSSWQDMPDRYATVNYVQGNIMSNDVAGTTAPVAFPVNVTAGNFIVVAISWDTTPTQSFSCADTRGSTYTNIGTVWNDATNTQGMSICYAPNITGGANTVTVTFGASVNFRRVVVSEYSGVATSNPVDVYGGIGAATTTATTDGTAPSNITTTQDGDLIFGASNLTAALRGYSAGTNFTQRMYTNTKDVAVEDRQQPQAGSVTAPWTMITASDKINLAVVAFKAATVAQ